MDKGNTPIEDSLGAYIRGMGHERPSDGFTRNVLAKLHSEAQPEISIQYRPLISRGGWWGLCLAFALLLAGLFGGFFPWETSLFGSFETAWPLNLKIPEIQPLDDSSPYVYAALALTIFSYFQIAFIKKYYSGKDPAL